MAIFMKKLKMNVKVKCCEGNKESYLHIASSTYYPYAKLTSTASVTQ
jgi:hypothetical protein